MLPALIALGVGRTETARIFVLPFDLTKHNFAFTQGYARMRARPVARLAELRPRVLRLFRPDRGPGAERSLRIAMDAGGGWLYVDEQGRAEIGHQRGAFDVVGWEKLIRRSPALRTLPRSDLVELRIVNRTPAATIVTDAFGAPILTVAARGTAATTTWFRPHCFVQGGRRVGKADNPLRRAEPSQGSRLKFRVERTKAHLLPGNGGVLSVRIIVEPL